MWGAVVILAVVAAVNIFFINKLHNFYNICNLPNSLIFDLQISNSQFARSAFVTSLLLRVVQRR